ncbi:MAG: sulfite exporter TauE/SafE family protein [Gammaproteobacteria bacterium]|jgi:uncharacterized membrane protein YfcA|nr:sulfite exporter TauE/SafE family protein [Gammaproteobacteria bacterium]MBU0786627.1 sulfite exporter TauE/SafE family protein [Gammaproteobacteria bacterium]MBU0814302.1 sulfite exporter TauE/SafE family protein [Gammaproteobacteria bacterium]MBU1786178.1 sulfite exporter TauE/SafE family protein [Gammaproteobacteria bacterium]
MPDFLTLLVAEPAVVVAYIVFGMVGFGSTLIAAPVLAHVLPVTTVIPSIAMTDLVAAWSNGLRLSKDVAKPELIRLAAALLIGSSIGAWLLFTLPIKHLMTMLGVFVMLYALNGLRHHEPKPPLTLNWAWFYGVVGGTFSTLFGAGGWVFSIYLFRRLDDPQQIRATQNAILMCSSFMRVAVFAVAGRLFDPALLWLVLMLVPAMALGLYVGHRISLRLDRQRFMQMVNTVLLITGSSLVLRALFGG